MTDERSNHDKRKRISPRQAEARRENGKQSRGPQSEEGKRRSAANSLKHGYWAKPLQAISRGPLAEDLDELTAFVGSVLEELDPGDSILLRQAALDVADKLWRLTRAQRWESEGYMAPEKAPPLTQQMEYALTMARRRRRGAEALRRFPDSSISQDDLWCALTPLAAHVRVAEEEYEHLEDAAASEVAAALIALVEEHFGSREEAAAWLDSKAEQRENEASIYYELNRPRVIRDEVDSSFGRNAERLISHASRELDRSLKRYWEMRGQPSLAPPAAAAPEEDLEDNEDADSSAHASGWAAAAPTAASTPELQECGDEPPVAGHPPAVSDNEDYESSPDELLERFSED